MTLLVTRYLYPFMFFCFHFFHRFIYWLISQRIVLSTCVAVRARVTLCVWVAANRVLWHIAEHKHSSGGWEKDDGSVRSVPIIPLEWENFLVPYCKLFDVEKPTVCRSFSKGNPGWKPHRTVSSTQGSFLRDPWARKGQGRCWSNFEVGPRLGKLLAETAQVLNMWSQYGDHILYFIVWHSRNCLDRRIDWREELEEPPMVPMSFCFVE